MRKLTFGIFSLFTSYKGFYWENLMIHTLLDTRVVRDVTQQGLQTCRSLQLVILETSHISMFHLGLGKSCKGILPSANWSCLLCTSMRKIKAYIHISTFNKYMYRWYFIGEITLQANTIIIKLNFKVPNIFFVVYCQHL